MNIYIAIITTVLVVTQIIRVCQNHRQLRRQRIVFEKQIGQLADCEPTKEDFETQRKAYRLIVKHFEDKKMMPPIIRETKRNVVNCYAVAEIDDLHYAHEPSALENKLMKEMAKQVLPYATMRTTKYPANYTVKAEATLDVLAKE